MVKLPGTRWILPLLAAILLHSPRIHAETRPKTPKLDSKAKAEIRTLIVDYFKASGSAARAEILRRIEAFDPVPKSVLSEFQRRAYKACMLGPRLKIKHATALETSQGTGKILISGVKKGKLQPLLIGLHGGGQGAGDGATSEQKWQSATGKGCICVFPTVIQKDATAWNKEREERYVLEILEAVKRSCRVDTNRVYLVGHSMGGFGTWSIGGHFADLFAAISPNAGGVFLVLGGKEPRAASGVLPNLYNTPVYFFHSTDDRQVGPKPDQVASKVLDALRKDHPGGYEHVYKEYNNIGHGMPPGGVGPILKYILAFKRDPYPKKVVFEPCRSYKRLFAWVEIPAGSGVKRLAAEFDRKTNTVTVATEGGQGGFTIYLRHDKMVDPKKEVVVLVNGKERFRGIVPYSVGALVRSFGEFRDPARFFTMRVRID